jgi:hypothetical protein
VRCSGCGKNVPFSGHVCPYCNRDKSSDQTGTVAAGAGLLLGGVIGNLIGGFGGMLIGGFVLGLLAAIVSMSGKNNTAKKPPRVRVDGLPAAKPQAVPTERVATLADTPEARLRRLDDLLYQGLLSEQEHQDRRKAIIFTL